MLNSGVYGITTINTISGLMDLSESNGIPYPNENYISPARNIIRPYATKFIANIIKYLLNNQLWVVVVLCLVIM